MQTGASETLLVSFGTCNFARTYNEAVRLMEISEATGLSEYTYVSCLPRIALLLFAVSLEALANRVVLDIEELNARHEIKERAATAEKWKQLAKWHPHSVGRFDTTSSLWRCFTELLDFRNEYVHPKGRVLDVQSGTHSGKGWWTGNSVLVSNRVPAHAKRLISDLKRPRVHAESLIPLSPYDVNYENATQGKRIVDGMCGELDRLLNGRLVRRQLLQEYDDAIAIHPDGGTQKLSILRGLGFEMEARRQLDPRVP